MTHLTHPYLYIHTQEGSGLFPKLWKQGGHAVPGVSEVCAKRSQRLYPGTKATQFRSAPQQGRLLPHAATVACFQTSDDARADQLHENASTRQQCDHVSWLNLRKARNGSLRNFANRRAATTLQVTRPTLTQHDDDTPSQPLTAPKIQLRGAVPRELAAAETAFRGNQPATHRIKSPLMPPTATDEPLPSFYEVGSTRR